MVHKLFSYKFISVAGPNKYLRTKSPVFKKHIFFYHANKNINLFGKKIIEKN